MLIILKTTSLFNFSTTKKQQQFELKLIKVSFWSELSDWLEGYEYKRFDWMALEALLKAPSRMQQFENPTNHFLSLSKWFKLSFIFQCPFHFGFHQFGLVAIISNDHRGFWLDDFCSYWSNWMQILDWWSYLVTFGSTSIFGKRRMEHKQRHQCSSIVKNILQRWKLSVKVSLTFEGHLGSFEVNIK